jgi:type I restriction enzyme S subunit
MRKMKDSGIEWIGKIPDTWNVIRLKNASWLKGRIGWQGLRAEEFTDEGPFLITGTDFKNGYVNWNTCVHISEQRFNQDLAIQIKENDLLITKDGTIGKLAIAKNCPKKVSLNSGVFIIRNTGKYKYDDKFMYYLLQSREFTLWFDLSNAGNSTICHLNQEKFYNFKFAYPSLPEQKKIADFLDGKCADIDQIRADVEKQIEILTDYKKSVITEAVTKGLDPKVKLKDSGIKWVGKIPEHWNVSKMKYACSKITDFTASGSFADLAANVTYLDSPDYAMLIRTADLSKKREVQPIYIDKHAYEYLSNSNLFGGEILLSNIGSVGDVYYFEPLYEKCSLAPNAIMAISKKSSRYLYYFFSMPSATEELRPSGGNAVQQKFNKTQLRQLACIAPPFEEQKAIASCLDEKCSEIDSAIEDKQKQLETLEDYKKSLIFEYVTGKKEVV